MNAKASQIIRRPAQECYLAFVEPQHLTKFWLSAASGPLTTDQTVRWDFLVPGASVEARAEILEPARRILLHWGPTQVEWTFSEHQQETVVSVEHRGLPDQEVAQSTEGFTLVLNDLKILLETGQSPGLVRDKAALIQRQS
ncbi:hypothetical protein ABS71_19400 [bacterium SCN 62-11]|nr:SRPBCC domain-containing protein [Candidatus Eremiobacteraeota bacterium]ODT57719.1 MAG: hypothetical protein ABS71_19400 [bacterium SCN 62-11]